MGASSSGLLDEAKVNHIKGLVDGAFQSFSGFYRQQYSVAYLGHLHQELEPKKEGRSLLLTQRPQYAPEEVLYQGGVKFSCWDEHGKKCRERYAVLRRDYKMEIHDSMETLKRGCAAKVVLQPAGGIVFTTEDESRAQLEKSCAGILNGVKEDSSSAALPPDVFAVYLHLPYRGPTCFLFQQENERDHFLSALKTCIRHCNLDPWHASSYENQAFARGLGLYRQNRGCYESWEKLLGTEEQVLASQVMEEALPWLQSQLQAKVKGKKTERLRQWLATVQATYTLVLEQLTAGLEALKMECRQTATASQALIRSNLAEIMSSHSFLEQKVQAYILEEAEKVCSESASPYMASILEALTENIGAGFLSMQHTLHAQMDAAFSLTNGETNEMKKVLSSLYSLRLDQSYEKVDGLIEKFEDLKQRFGLTSTQRLVHSTHLEMEQLLDRAVYTLEKFLQSSTRLQPSQVPVKMERAKERVLKQLDYDSRVVQRRLYQEALLEISLPSLVRRLDSKWKTGLQQFEQYIFSDYSAFILVQNVFDDILRSLLRREIETVVQDAVSRKSNHLLLDTSDLAISQYSLLGQTPPCSAPDSPANRTRLSSSAPKGDRETAPAVEDNQTADVFPQNDAELKDDTKSDSSAGQPSGQSTTPVIVVTQQQDDCGSNEAQHLKETSEEAKINSDATSAETDSGAAESSISDVSVTHDAPDPQADQGSTNSDYFDPSALDFSQSSDAQSEYSQSESSQSDLSTTPETNPSAPEPSTFDQMPEEASSMQPSSPPHSPGADESAMKISLGSLSEAVTPSSMDPEKQKSGRQITDRAVYLTGRIKDNWEVERMEGKVNEAVEKEEKETTMEGQKEEREEQVEGEDQTGDKPINEGCTASASPAEHTVVTSTEQTGSEGRMDEKGDELNSEAPKDNEGQAAEEGSCAEEENREKEVPPSLQEENSQPDGPAELLGSVATIRELVTEITEVETVLTSCPTSSSSP
ncbi:protein Niban 1-like isoform X2 [Cololabis saira]|uniref:protein Niban 1-like isoform X2 n=1 Tax=Cololabis saira TaxID=129043 RepID=UPI002AD2F7BF|nr:protein Niban 1-like isoform X2 [Cololabis saira]